jgi:hypothetical protein
MIGPLGSTGGIGERHGHGSQLASLCTELNATLRRLEAIAAEPPGRRAVDELQRLQYGLHLFAERLVGISPPGGVETAQAELAEALASARDATAEVAEAANAGGRPATQPLVWEWRGALFRLRLARMLVQPPQRVAALKPPDSAPRLVAPLAAFGLTAAGATAFVLGAILALWPLWTIGVFAVIVGMIVYRP